MADHQESVTVDKDDSLPRCELKDGVYHSPFRWRMKTIKELLHFQCCYQKNVLEIGVPGNVNVTLIKARELNERLFKPVLLEEKPNCTWLCHASCLFRAGGVSFLTDPVFSDRASPSQWAGPLRYTPMPAGAAALHVDVVLLSHTHYDHLDVATIKAIGNGPLWICPKGVKTILASLGVTNSVELEWWDSYAYKKPDDSGATASIVFTPAAHWTNRSLTDINTCLWGSYCVKNDTASFFFMGDSGYDDKLFDLIGAKFGPFDVAALGIGAYRPREFLKDQHVNPMEAVKVHQDLRARRSVGIHWGTFPLSLEVSACPPSQDPLKTVASSEPSPNP